MKTKRETLIKPNATADKRIRMKLKKTKKKKTKLAPINRTMGKNTHEFIHNTMSVFECPICSI